MTLASDYSVYMVIAGLHPPELIARNDWAPLRPPDPATWQPALPVTTIVTAGRSGGEQATAATVAALRRQNYPADLLEVVVTGAAPEPPPVAGPILLRIPAGALPAPTLVATLARWQHLNPDVVSLAAPIGPAQPVHGLRTADRLAFLALNGVPYAFHRSRVLGDTDPLNHTDLELGYRLGQAGAVFVPDAEALAWPPSELAAAPQPAPPQPCDTAAFLAWLAAGTGAAPPPLVVVAVKVDGGAEQLRDCVGRLLASDLTDLRVLLVPDEVRPAAAPLTGRPADSYELGRLAAEYQNHARVDVVDRAPETAFPSPYLLRLPSRLGVGKATAGSLVKAAERWHVGLVRVLPAGARSADAVAELWSTAALNRARLNGVQPADLASAVAASHGQRWETGSEFGVIDLTAPVVVQPDLGPAPARRTSPLHRLRDLRDEGGAWWATRVAARALLRRARRVRRRLGRR